MPGKNYATNIDYVLYVFYVNRKVTLTKQEAVDDFRKLFGDKLTEVQISKTVSNLKQNNYIKSVRVKGRYQYNEERYGQKKEMLDRITIAINKNRLVDKKEKRVKPLDLPTKQTTVEDAVPPEYINWEEMGHAIDGYICKLKRKIIDLEDKLRSIQGHEKALTDRISEQTKVIENLNQKLTAKNPERKSSGGKFPLSELNIK